MIDLTKQVYTELKRDIIHLVIIPTVTEVLNHLLKTPEARVTRM